MRSSWLVWQRTKKKVSLLLILGSLVKSTKRTKDSLKDFSAMQVVFAKRKSILNLVQQELILMHSLSHPKT